MTNNNLKLESKQKHTFLEDTSILPPDQVFVDSNLTFLLTTGGGLIENGAQFDLLMNLLSILGEKEITILENPEATIPHKPEAFRAKLKTSSRFSEYKKIENSYEPPFGFAISSFYVFGEKRKWGIYLCECPTILLIGCMPDLADKFRSVYNIKGNGYEDLKSFIAKEFNNKKDLIEKLEKNYKLNS